jgi:Ribbon-helix-helix protein, copG family
MRQYDRFMPRGAPFSRIAITLPSEDLAAADRLAAEQDRSRSWIVAEAVRRYVAANTAARQIPVLDASRREQLRRDLALLPADRIRAAEEGVRIVDRLTSLGQDPITFPNFDAFLAWSRQNPSGR